MKCAALRSVNAALRYLGGLEAGGEQGCFLLDYLSVFVLHRGPPMAQVGIRKLYLVSGFLYVPAGIRDYVEDVPTDQIGHDEIKDAWHRFELYTGDGWPGRHVLALRLETQVFSPHTAKISTDRVQMQMGHRFDDDIGR
jgi:hypothetical protein